MLPTNCQIDPRSSGTFCGQALHNMVHANCFRWESGFKMVQRMYVFKAIILFHSLFLAAYAQAQSAARNAYGLETVADMTGYRKMGQTDSMKRLVDLAEYIPSLRLDIKYATRENFLGE